MYVYIENLKDPSVRFRVVEYDKESKMGKLEGEYGAKFSRDLSKASLAKFGYKIVKSEKQLALVSSPKAREKGKKAKKVAATTADDEEE
jgi:hypothetical protein